MDGDELHIDGATALIVDGVRYVPQQISIAHRVVPYPEPYEVPMRPEDWNIKTADGYDVVSPAWISEDCYSARYDFDLFVKAPDQHGGGLAITTPLTNSYRVWKARKWKYYRSYVWNDYSREPGDLDYPEGPELEVETLSPGESFLYGNARGGLYFPYLVGQIYGYRCYWGSKRIVSFSDLDYQSWNTQRLRNVFPILGLVLI